METPKTARALGLMQGFPPEAEKLVTLENQLLGPYNRWSFQNELAMNKTVDVWRGNGPVAALEYDLRDLSRVLYKNRLGTEYSFNDMVEMSCTDGIIVLHQGKVIYERYLNDMQPHTLHAWASGSKSMTGTLAALLAHEGPIDLDAPVTLYLPELADSGFAGATVRHLADMTVAVRFRDDTGDLVVENEAYGKAMGWREQQPGYDGPRTAYDFLPGMLPAGPHGERFTYLTPATDVLAWIIKRVEGKTLAEVMRERIWSKLGADRDAFWIVGPAAVETAGSGLVTTLPDMARFGQMLLQKGHFNGQQILPASAVEDIERGGDPAAFARWPGAGPTNQGWSYHHQWWNTHNPYGAYFAMGYGGQMLYIAPGVELVIAKVSSYPTPTPAGNEFYSAFAAFPVLESVLAMGLL